MVLASATRRAALSRVLAGLSIVHFAPRDAPAALPPPPPEVAKLVAARAKAQELVTELPGRAPDEVLTYVATFTSINLKDAPALVERLVPALGERAAPIPAELTQSLEKLRVAARQPDDSRAAATAEAKAVLGALDEAIKLAASAFAVPAAAPERFDTTSYFGPFTCEGVGLQRKPDSNECVPKDKKGDENADAGA